MALPARATDGNPASMRSESLDPTDDASADAVRAMRLLLRSARRIGDSVAGHEYRRNCATERKRGWAVPAGQDDIQGGGTRRVPRGKRLLWAILTLVVALSAWPAYAVGAGSGPPVNTVLPAISGSVVEGQALKVSSGMWSGAEPIRYAYQWERCQATGGSCAAIAKATKTSYKPGAADVDHTIRVSVTASNGIGSVAASSGATSLVTGVRPSSKGLPKITGVAKTNMQLKASTGSWKGSVPLSYSYQWELCNSAGIACSNISEAAEASYRPVKTQVGDTLRIVVTARNAAGAATATSKATEAISLGTPVAQIDLCGPISHSQELSPEVAAAYVLTCFVTVDRGATLTIAPGAVVKASGGNGCLKGGQYGLSCSLEVKGALDAVGTASQPIVFTSLSDNSVGGTTGDGTPQPDDWDGIAAYENGTLDIEHADINYARVGVQGEEAGTLVLKNNAFANELYGAADIEGPAPTLLDNTSNNSGGTAFRVTSETLNANLLGGNSATGNGSEVVELAGTLGTSSTLPDEPAAWGLAGRVLVPAGKTLTIAPGAVVKASGGNGCLKGGQYGLSCSLEVKGALDAVGTASQPIVFTSLSDNSVGGTTGDGTPQPDDWDGIAAYENGTLDIEHADINYARVGVQGEPTGEQTVYITVDNNTLSHNATAISIAASPGTNAAIHRNWFDENGMALAGSSDWNPVDLVLESCQYVPSMSATDNVYGPHKASGPFVTASEASAILAALLVPETEESPGGWVGDLEAGETDRITWALLGCQPVDEDHPHAVVATPFDIG